MRCSKRLCPKGAFLLLSSSFLLFLMIATPSHGFELKPDELRGKSSKKPVSVLQNRFFLKAWRPEIGFLGGTFLKEAYTKTTLYGVRMGLFFNEWVGAEFQLFKTIVEDSDDRKALNEKEYRKKDSGDIVSPDPEVNAIYGATDFNAVFAPFYGKLNLLDSFIIYSDLYIIGGISKVQTQQGDLNAFQFGVGQRFYMLKSLSIRVDFRDRIYNEQRNEKNSTKNAYSVDFGASYFFM